MTKVSTTCLSATGVLLMWTSSFAETVKPANQTGCPAPVVGAIERTLAGSAIRSCKAEREHGREQVEVKVTRADGVKVEVDMTPDGKILQIEEPVPLDQVPAAVVKAFSARYQKAKIDTAEKQTPTGGVSTYELGFASAHGRKAATFRQDGTFIEEE